MKKVLSIFSNPKAILVGVFTLTILIGGTVAFTTAQTEGEDGEDEPVLAGIPPKPSEEMVEAGKVIYFKKCVWCHGTEGAGDGPGADRLWPRPRDFTQGTFKIRNTRSGELPLENDLFLTVTHGLPGSAMPPWKGILSEEERHQVVSFVMTLVQDRDFFDEENEEYVMLGDGPQVKTSAESIERGREVYMNKGKCVECHGNEGRGDGNATQKDEWGFPIFPADLSKCWNFRGSRAEPYNAGNVFREVSTGLNGTPMPSFEDALTVEQRWDVANFTMSLCPKYEIDPLTDHPTSKFVVRSSFNEGEIPTNPEDEAWEAIDSQYIGLAGQIIHKPRNFVRLVDDIRVKTMFNENEIAWYFQWNDRNKSVATSQSLAMQASFKETPPAGQPIANMIREYPVFNDAIAVWFPARWQELTPPEKPRFVFGDVKKPVDVWKWEADGKTQEYTGNGAMGGELKLAARSGKNLRVTYSDFQDGQWRVIMTRALKTEGEGDVQFELGEYIPTVFFAWDGNNGDYGLKGSISTWYYTILEPPIPTKAYVYPFFALIFVGGIELWILKKLKANKA